MANEGMCLLTVLTVLWKRQLHPVLSVARRSHRNVGTQWTYNVGWEHRMEQTSWRRRTLSWVADFRSSRREKETGLCSQRQPALGCGSGNQSRPHGSANNWLCDLRQVLSFAVPQFPYVSAECALLGLFLRPHLLSLIPHCCIWCLRKHDPNLLPGSRKV